MDLHLNDWLEDKEKRAIGQAGFRREWSTLDHLLTLQTMIDTAKERGRTLYVVLVDFKKAFDSVPRGPLLQKLEDIGVPEDIQTAVNSLYHLVTGKVRVGGSYLATLSVTLV